MKLKSLPLLLSAALLCSAPCAMAGDVVIHAGKLIDAVSGQVAEQMSILITDERITAVQRGFVTPAGAAIVDLSGATVLPGLIDCHVHMAGGIIGEGGGLAQRFTSSSPTRPSARWATPTCCWAWVLRRCATWGPRPR